MPATRRAADWSWSTRLFSCNRFAGNALHGLVVEDPASRSVSVRSCIFEANGGKPVVLAEGSNGDIQPPVITDINSGRRILFANRTVVLERSQQIGGHHPL